MTPLEEMIIEQWDKDDICHGEFYIDDDRQAVLDSIIRVIDQLKPKQ